MYVCVKVCKGEQKSTLSVEKAVKQNEVSCRIYSCCPHRWEGNTERKWEFNQLSSRSVWAERAPTWPSITTGWFWLRLTYWIGNVHSVGLSLWCSGLRWGHISSWFNLKRFVLIAVIVHLDQPGAPNFGTKKYCDTFWLTNISGSCWDEPAQAWGEGDFLHPLKNHQLIISHSKNALKIR